MKTYHLALAILFGSIAGAALVVKALPSHVDAVSLVKFTVEEQTPPWATCSISLDCLRF